MMRGAWSRRCQRLGARATLANIPPPRDYPRMKPERLTGIIVGIGVVSCLLVLWLVVSEISLRPTCPDLLGIPACYAVLAAYGVATGAAWFPVSRAATVLFYLGTGAALVIAIWLSSCELGGTGTCPSFEGLPMCFTSLLGSGTMLALDLIRRRL